MTADLRAHVRVRRDAFAVDVALAAAPGETLAVMGPSGAGKSTLLGALAGLVPLDSGEVTVDGRVLDRVGGGRGVHVAPMRRGVVLLGQDARLFPHLTARENVAFGPRAAGAPRGKARAEADAWLERVGLSGAGSRRPDELSGGQQQRVAVARALAASPRVVLLDEPLVALDPATASEIRGVLRDQLAGVTTIAVTHDAVDAVALADRLVVIEGGLVTQSGDVREVLAAPATDFVATIAGVTRLLGVATDRGWEGLGFRLASEQATTPAEGGAPLAAVFRPDAVRRAAGGEVNSWTARVRALEPVLAGVRVRTDRGDVDLDVVAAAELRPGDAIRLAIDPSLVRLIPA